MWLSILTGRLVWALSGYRNLLSLKTPWRAKPLLRGIVKSMGSMSGIILLTMGPLHQMHGGNHVSEKDKASLLLVLQHTIKMA